MIDPTRRTERMKRMLVVTVSQLSTADLKKVLRSDAEGSLINSRTRRFAYAELLRRRQGRAR